MEGGPIENRLMLFNEVMISMYLYTLIALSDFAPDSYSVRLYSGWTLLGIIFFSCVVNLSKFFLNVGRELRRGWLKRRKA